LSFVHNCVVHYFKSNKTHTHTHTHSTLQQHRTKNVDPRMMEYPARDSTRVNKNTRNDAMKPEWSCSYERLPAVLLELVSVDFSKAWYACTAASTASVYSMGSMDGVNARSSCDAHPQSDPLELFGGNGQSQQRVRQTDREKRNKEVDMRTHTKAGYRNVVSVGGWGATNGTVEYMQGNQTRGCKLL
jgi:hypothetical protein